MRTLADDTRCSSKCQLRSLDQSTVTEDIWRRAEKELNETEETRDTCLQELRILLKGETKLNANTSDEFLLQFLRAKKFRIQAAFCMIKNYYGHRAVYSSLYQNYSPKRSSKIMDSNHFIFLPWRTPEDCAVWVARVGLWDPKEFGFEELLSFGVRCNEKALQNPVTQICGIVSIVDLQGFSWSHLLHTPASLVRCFVSVAQDCIPIRHKAIHIINNPSIFGLLFAVMKPFITSKIRNRIHFHGYSLNSLHAHLPPSTLPEEFGGTLGPIANTQFYDSLLASEDAFLEDWRHGYGTSQ